MSLAPRFRWVLILPLLIATGQCGRDNRDLSGRWNATIVSEGTPIPFRLDLAVNGKDAKGYFFDGERQIASTSGSFENNHLHLHFDLYSADLDVNLVGDSLKGTYVRHRPKQEYSRVVTATRYLAETAGPGSSRSIAGDWELRGKEDNKDVAWKMVLEQKGSLVQGAILRLDGDTGALTGTFQGDKLSLSHFSGARPALLEGTLASDDTLDLLLDRKVKLIGVRAGDPKAKQLAPEPDAFRATTVKNPKEPLLFAAPDVNGRIVSASDPQFKNKVVIVSIGGTWCPNCMDEAPFLIDLYRRYHAQGLEIVGLNFESGDVTYDRARVHSFVNRYTIPYPILIAGTTDEAAAKLPQLVNFSAFPTTIFVGRDGRVKYIHDGFASVATGSEHVKLKQQTQRIVENLLAGAS